MPTKYKLLPPNSEQSCYVHFCICWARKWNKLLVKAEGSFGHGDLDSFFWFGQVPIFSWIISVRFTLSSSPILDLKSPPATSSSPPTATLCPQRPSWFPECSPNCQSQLTKQIPISRTNFTTASAPNVVCLLYQSQDISAFWGQAILIRSIEKLHKTRPFPSQHLVCLAQ